MSTPEHESPVNAGDVAIVAADTLTTRNDVGGTASLRHAETTCVVTKAWWDDETGWRYAGRLADEAVVAEVRAQATTGYDAEHYRRTYPSNPALAESAELAARAFDPAAVNFGEMDLVAAPTPGMR